jgi:hypothetical protein
MIRIARVFPRRTQATPTDALAFTDEPGLLPPDVDEVHVSVAFTWDLPRAEYLAKAWERVAPVTTGGPAVGSRGEEFVPGRYLRQGYVITSRGCPNKCWFCSVWRREGGEVRTLPIHDGFNLLDDNLLACPEDHIRAVFAMLKRQREPIQFSGGLEAARLEPWHVDLLTGIRLGQVFFAYDTPDDWDPLVHAATMLREAGLLSGRKARVYMLIGFPRDTLEAAQSRLENAFALGFWPVAMLWRNQQTGTQSPEWRHLQREWFRPALMHVKKREGHLASAGALRERSAQSGVLL